MAYPRDSLVECGEMKKQDGQNIGDKYMAHKPREIRAQRIVKKTSQLTSFALGRGQVRSPDRRRLCAIVILCVLVTGSMQAHDTWVSPSAYSSATGKPVIFALTSGMKFPALETGPKPERIAKAGFCSAAEKGEIKDLTGAEEALRGTLSFAEAGIVTVWFEARPRELDLTDEQVVEYLDEIHAPAAIRETWEKQKGRQKWKETYIKCAKTAVAVGDGAGDKTWSEPVGMALEIVPLTNPVTAKAGQGFSLKLLRDGQPVPQASIALVEEGHENRVFQVTDADGLATFTPTKAGQYLFTCVILEPAGKNSIWKSRFTTFTFQAKSALR